MGFQGGLFVKFFCTDASMSRPGAEVGFVDLFFYPPKKSVGMLYIARIIAVMHT
jgi:hypothetical protein